MRVNGQVSGSLNGVSLDDSILHAFLMFQDGRVYIAISGVGTELGYSMQGLFSFAGGLGWLLALPTLPTAKNGYQITGTYMETTYIFLTIESSTYFAPIN